MTTKTAWTDGLHIWVVQCLAGWLWITALPASGAVANVNIVDFAFSPTNVTIKVNDKVAWFWVGSIPHSSTSDTAGLWDSTILPSGSTFTNTFGSAGSFPYHCTLHSFMRASVTVQGQTQTNAPPTVSITAPPNGAVFAAPWTGKIQASASDSDGTVSNVAFFAGTSLLGTIANPPPAPSFTVTNLAAGNYTLTAVATDNGGASTTSAGVSIKVVTPAPITLSSAKRLSTSSFQFNYTVTPGLSYVVEQSADLLNWVRRGTNAASSNPATFTDNTATVNSRFYRVTLLPNP